MSAFVKQLLCEDLAIDYDCDANGVTMYSNGQPLLFDNGQIALIDQHKWEMGNVRNLSKIFNNKLVKCSIILRRLSKTCLSHSYNAKEDIEP